MLKTQNKVSILPATKEFPSVVDIHLLLDVFVSFYKQFSYPLNTT